MITRHSTSIITKKYSQVIGYEICITKLENIKLKIWQYLKELTVLLEIIPALNKLFLSFFYFAILFFGS